MAKIDNTLPVDAYRSLLERQAREQMRRIKKGMRGRMESELQRKCVAWFRWKHPDHALLLFAVPNGGGRSKAEAAIMKAEGVTAGVADLILLEARGGWGALCIEMKTEMKGSAQSKRQKEWQQAAETFGNRYVVVRTEEEFREVVNAYLGMSPSVTGKVFVRKEELEARISLQAKPGGNGKGNSRF